MDFKFDNTELPIPGPRFVIYFSPKDLPPILPDAMPFAMAKSRKKIRPHLLFHRELDVKFGIQIYLQIFPRWVVGVELENPLDHSSAFQSTILRVLPSLLGRVSV